ncbi:MAG TPA: hypothetical protein VHY48_01495 [Acidobacteriaceae bacterium]|jgi:hypothetical protein|nr:hypothetical protein [Acidobacteriaceae bacterium]
MPPPRASSADSATSPQTPEQIAAAIEAFLTEHQKTAVMEDGKILFDLASDRWSLSTEHGRCTLHLWSEERNMVRNIVSAAPRADSLRLATRRLGQAQPKLLELINSRERWAATTRNAARARYLKLLQRVLTRNFPDWRPEGLRAAMDLERSFGPAYIRGTLLRGAQAWAVIGVDEHESVAIMEGVLTLGVLWLHCCREQGGGRRLYQGLKVIVPRGAAALTLARMGWLNPDAAQWELYELDQASEELTQCDLVDRGNLRTRLVHRPDDRAAVERFAAAIAEVLTLVPSSDHQRVEHRLRSSSELGFFLHGLEFARARISLAPGSFARTLEITVGTGSAEMPLTPATREELAAHVAELFERRNVLPPTVRDRMRSQPPSRRIGEPTVRPAHSRLPLRGRGAQSTAGNPAQDPLFRAAPERWLESALRQNLAPLTRGIAPEPTSSGRNLDLFANDPDPDTRGNRADVCEQQPDFFGPDSSQQPHSRVLPRLDPRHVYAQVPAIAGASDRGLLDLLGVTADGRLAVLELKADDDLHFALQGLDYWIRVRHHHLQTADPRTGLGEFQRHGYFRGVELSPLPPRLYLVAPALHIHPVTETVLRYLSPSVEWHLLALDERWRQQVRVVWRKSSA